MLAPIDKVRRRGGNDIIQLVITRKCDLFTCANCTQLLPFRKDGLEMSLECVEAALIATKGWPGVIACFGGNPTNHSKFPEICELFIKHIPDQAKRGLWTNNLMRHAEIIKKTFWPRGRFNLNVHGNAAAAAVMKEWLPGIPVFGEQPSHHGAMLLDRKDYGISDEDWVTMREKCDINQNWSGAIYEREGRPHAYFCEVAGSLDGVRRENHGIPVEPGWWEWGMDRFQDQVRNCCDRGCGVPLRQRGASDETTLYNISPSWQAATAEPVSKRTTTRVEESLPGAVRELTDYAKLRG